MKFTNAFYAALFLASCCPSVFAAQTGPGTLLPDGRHICTSNTIGGRAATEEDIRLHRIHHMIVSADWSTVTVYFVEMPGRPIAPIMLRRSNDDGYTVSYGRDRYPEVVDSPAVTVNKSIDDYSASPGGGVSFSNWGVGESITCVENF